MEAVCLWNGKQFRWHFTFNESWSVRRVTFFGIPKPRAERKLCITSVKTQFAGITTHTIVAKLFRYLSDKYFTNYPKWLMQKHVRETGDMKMCYGKFWQWLKPAGKLLLSQQTAPYWRRRKSNGFILNVCWKYINKWGNHKVFILPQIKLSRCPELGSISLMVSFS